MKLKEPCNNCGKDERCEYCKEVLDNLSKYRVSSENTSPITREDFMEFFRSMDGWDSLTTYDRKEIFLQVLLGQSDITRDLLERLARNYGTTLEAILEG